MPPPQHHLQQPQGCSLPGSLEAQSSETAAPTQNLCLPLMEKQEPELRSSLHRAKLCKSCTPVKRGVLCFFPLQWFIAFEGSAVGSCSGTSLCQCHNFLGALGPHTGPRGRIQAAGHQLDSPAGISSSNKDRNRHEHISS